MLETIPVRPEERFDLAAVARFLAGHIEGLDPDHIEVEQFPAGHSNLTYSLRSGSWEGVLRRPPRGPVAPKAHDMGREFRILERIHPVFPLAPRPYVFCADESVIGVPFYVMERRHGVVLDQHIPPGFDTTPQHLKAIAHSLVQVLVDLHAVDWKVVDGHPEGYMQRQVSGWLERYARARTVEVPELAPLARWLTEQLPASPPPTIIHNDYKLNNVLLNPDDTRRITAVLDWEMATVGDPLSDVASLLVYWTEPGDEELLGGLRSVTAQPGFPRRDEIANLYAQLSGRDLASFDFYRAFAYFKVAVICQQIYYRWKMGQTTDSRFAGHERVACNLIGQAARTARLI